MLPIIRKLTALVVVLMIAVAALVIALVAETRAGNIGNCINTNLGQRSGPTAHDARAHIAFARAVDGLFLTPSATQAERIAEAARFKVQVQAYVDTLVKDQADRDAHPLGRC